MRGKGSLGGQKLDLRTGNLLAAGIESHCKWDQHATHCERYTLHYGLGAARHETTQREVMPRKTITSDGSFTFQCEPLAQLDMNDLRISWLKCGRALSGFLGLDSGLEANEQTCADSHGKHSVFGRLLPGWHADPSRHGTQRAAESEV